MCVETIVANCLSLLVVEISHEKLRKEIVLFTPRGAQGCWDRGDKICSNQSNNPSLNSSDKCETYTVSVRRQDTHQLVLTGIEEPWTSKAVNWEKERKSERENSSTTAHRPRERSNTNLQKFGSWYIQQTGYSKRVEWVGLKGFKAQNNFFQSSCMSSSWQNGLFCADFWLLTWSRHVLHAEGRSSTSEEHSTQHSWGPTRAAQEQVCLFIGLWRLYRALTCKWTTLEYLAWDVTASACIPNVQNVQHWRSAHMCRCASLNMSIEKKWIWPTLHIFALHHHKKSH